MRVINKSKAFQRTSYDDLHMFPCVNTSLTAVIIYALSNTVSWCAVTFRTHCVWNLSVNLSMSAKSCQRRPAFISDFMVKITIKVLIACSNQVQRWSCREYLIIFGGLALGQGMHKRGRILGLSRQFRINYALYILRQCFDILRKIFIVGALYKRPIPDFAFMPALSVLSK